MYRQCNNKEVLL